MSFARLFQKSTKMFSRDTAAVPAIRWPIFHPPAMCSLACSFPCLAATCARNPSATSGTDQKHSLNFVPCMCAICPPARIAAIRLIAPAARVLLTWKETCAALRASIAQSQKHERESPVPGTSARATHWAIPQIQLKLIWSRSDWYSTRSQERSGK